MTTDHTPLPTGQRAMSDVELFAETVRRPEMTNKDVVDACLVAFLHVKEPSARHHGESFVDARDKYEIARNELLRRLNAPAPDVLATVDAATLGVIAEIANERRHQIADNGFTAEHDDQWTDMELPDAAACYARSDNGNWPWDLRWWKDKGKRQNLLRAAALIVAEIERMDRSALTDAPAAEGA